MHYYAIAPLGDRDDHWREVRVTRAPYADGRVNRGMRLVGQQPTGVIYAGWQRACRAVADKNLAIARERYGR
jgi:hypothetical protein